MYMYIGTVYESAVLNCRSLYCRVYPLSTRVDTITCARHFTCFTVMAVSSDLWRKESRAVVLINFTHTVPDLKAIFGPSFFNLKAIVSYNIG